MSLPREAASPESPPAPSRARAIPAAQLALAQSLVLAGRLRQGELDACLAELEALGGPERVSLVEIFVRRGFLEKNEATPALERVETTRIHETHKVAPDPYVLLESTPPLPKNDSELVQSTARKGWGERPRDGVPRRIGRYDIQGELGRGGMGIVYRARDAQLGRPVAIKVMREVSIVGEEAVARFRREAATCARLKHPSIVQVHEVGEHEGAPFLAMELVEGESLEALLAKEPLSPRRLAKVVREVADALHHAHRHGVIHRDLKPSNVIVDREGRAHLMDFGLARSTAASTQLTATGDVLGTPAYMAPEQARGDPREQTAAIDVYALGALLYRGLAGKPPFQGPTAQALLWKVVYEESEPIAREGREIPPDLETIALRCMAKAPERRLASAAEVASELGRYLDGLPIRSRPIGIVERAAFAVRRRAGVAVAIGVAASVAFLVFVWLWTEKEIIARSEEAQRRSVEEAERRKAAHAQAESLGRSAERAFEARDYKRAFEAASEAIEVEPANGRAWFVRALVRLFREDADGAIADFTRLLEIDPGNGEAWANRAVARAKKGDLSGAIDDATKAIEHDPRLALGWLERGVAREAKGEHEGAIADLSRAIEIHPLNPNAWGNRAVARVSTGDHDGAIADCTRALEIEPSLAWVLRWRAVAKGRKNDLAGEMEDETRVLELDPRDAIALANRAGAHLNRGEFDRALADATRSVELEPKLANAWANRGGARLGKGDDEGAIADCSRAIELDATNVAGWINRGAARLQKGERPAAIADLTKAIELDAKRPNAWCNRGLARLQSGDALGAEDLERYLELVPDEPRAGEYRKLIDRARGR